MPLELAEIGCCRGHVCDACRTCNTGRCCRNDNPDYRLPSLGDWDGPIYGEVGRLVIDGDRLECHACGNWFENLATHVRRSHDLLADEYKSIFGLKTSTGLTSPRLRSISASVGRKSMKHINDNGLRRPPTPEQLSAINKGRSKRPEELRGELVFSEKMRTDPDFRRSIIRAQIERRGRRAVEFNCVECGKPWIGAEGTRFRACESRTCRERSTARARSENLRRAVQERAEAARVVLTCPICGKSFTRTKFWAEQRKTCSRLCGRQTLNESHERICINCGARFMTAYPKQKFHSKKCQNQFNHRRRPKRPTGGSE